MDFNTTPDRLTTRRRRKPVMWLIAFTILVNACAAAAEPTTTTSGASATSTTTPAPEKCPTTEAMLSQMNDATYAVYGEVKSKEGSETRHLAIGTAWAVDANTLVTNAHVSEIFAKIAAGGTQLTRALAVQSRTGTVVTLEQAFVHEGYDGDPLASPDVGLLTTKEILPVTLPLSGDVVELPLGAEILLVGFPGDVTQLIEIIPGETIPQATSLTGQITALRSHDATAVVGPEDVDVVQHQAPTTPGTSGSAMVACGRVIAVNNAGTVNLILVPTDDQGGTGIERQAAAANNFGVHVRHIHSILERFELNELEAVTLPVPASQVDTAPELIAAVAGTYVGSVQDETAAHEFTFTISADGTVTGTSQWPATGEFTLTGELMPDQEFDIAFIDDAPERLDFRRGVYAGIFLEDGSLLGKYFESSREDQTWDWTATRAAGESGGRRLGFGVNEFVDRWNAFADNSDLFDRFRLGALEPTQVNETEDFIDVDFGSGLLLGIVVDRGDGAVIDLLVSAEPASKEDSDDMLLAVVLAVAAVSPELDPDDRVAVVGETGLLAAEDGNDFEGTTTRGDIEYAAAALDGMFLFYIGPAG